jgi:ATP-dependent DNA helicase RecQ
MMRADLGAPINMLRSSSAVSADWINIREAVLQRDNYKCLECGTPCRAAEADVHHLLPRSAEGTDEPSNLVTLCDGCHAAHHPKLAGRLARRIMEKWAVRVALWFDRHRTISDASRNFGAALRLFGLERFRDGQLPLSRQLCVGNPYSLSALPVSARPFVFSCPPFCGRVSALLFRL